MHPLERGQGAQRRPTGKHVRDGLGVESPGDARVRKERLDFGAKDESLAIVIIEERTYAHAITT